MVKKLLSMFMAVAFLFTLSACTPSSDGDTTITTVSPAEITDAEETAEAVESENSLHSYYDENFPSYETIQSEYPDKTVLTWIFDSTIYENLMPFRTEEINEYLDSSGCDFAVCFQPVTVESDAYYVDVVEKMTESGEQIDIIHVEGVFLDEGMTYPYHNYVQRGLLEPLDKYFETELGKQLYDLMPEKHWKTLTVNGSIYGVDGMLTDLGTDYGYFVNAELADKYGFDISKPIEEQLDILQQVKENESCNVFALDMSKLYEPTCYFTDARKICNAVYWDNKTHSAKCILDDPDYLEKLRLFYSLNKSGLAVNSFLIKSETFFISQENIKGGYAMYHDNPQPVDYDYKKDGKTVKAYPVFNQPTALKTGYNATGICAASQHKDKAFQLLALVQTDPYLNNLMTYGIEGEDYQLISEGKISDDDSNVYCLDRYANLMICIKNTYKWEKIPDLTAEEYCALYEESYLDEDIDFVFNGIGLEKEIAATSLALDKFTIPGQDMTIDEAVEKLREQLYDSGLQKIIDECNRQYTEYRENKDEN